MFTKELINRRKASLIIIHYTDRYITIPPPNKNLPNRNDIFLRSC